MPKSTLFPKYQRYRSQMLTSKIEELNQDYVKISRLCRENFPRNKPSMSITVGSGQTERGRFNFLID